MTNPNPFDRRIDILTKSRETPKGVVDAAVFVHDTIELAWMAAEDVFGDKATPDVALAIYDRIAARMPRAKGSR
jgi:hypothetical protein